MAVLYIAELENAVSSIGTTAPQIPPMPPVTSQTVAIGGASSQSAAFGATTHAVLLGTDAICSVKFGSDPTATATDTRLPANALTMFGVRPGDKVAVITNT